MRAVIAAWCLIAISLVMGCAAPVADGDNGGLFEAYRDTDVPISSAALFEAERYTGRWYEIARYPVAFERGCAGVTADYGIIDTQTISVRNTCRGADGAVRSVIDGTAQIIGPARLAVSFPSVPFAGASDYWVLWVDADYQTAVVGAPNGRSGWILNRSPDIPADRLQAARDVLAFNGYDLSRLLMVPQVQ
jgi:apolipoprotein D and lipocalin family protein